MEQRAHPDARGANRWLNVVSPVGLSEQSNFNGFHSQMGVIAHSERKGFSCAVTN
jgi:hypothetical protein